MRKIFTFFILILFLSGCDIGNQSAKISDEEYHTGTEGLVIEFMDNMPPEKVYETDTFPAGIKLENKGAYDIKNGYLLLNIEQDNLDLQKGSLKRSLEIDGRSISNPYGESQTINYLLKANELGKETETLTSTIIATECYEYKTEFLKTVCVDTDFYNLKKVAKACSSEDIESSDGQGAPVSISKVESKMLEEDDVLKPTFIVYITNNGNGQVINSDSVSAACSETGFSREDINYIKVSSFFASEGASLTCKPDSVKLKDNMAVVRCVYEDGIDKNKESYSTLLKIELDYGYTQTISQSVQIRGGI